MKIEVDLPILREATIALGGIIQQLPSLKARESQDQLIGVWKRCTSFALWRTKIPNRIIVRNVAKKLIRSGRIAEAQVDMKLYVRNARALTVGWSSEFIRFG